MITVNYVIYGTYTGLDTNTYPLSFEREIYFLESKTLKMNQSTYPIWKVNFGLCWKVTVTLKDASVKNLCIENKLSNDKNNQIRQ